MVIKASREPTIPERLPCRDQGGSLVLGALLQKRGRRNRAMPDYSSVHNYASAPQTLRS